MAKITVPKTTIPHIPKEVGKSFYCHGCGNKFTEIDVLKVCNVNGDVFV